MTEDLLERLAVGFRERTAGAPALELRCDGGREPASLEIPPEWKVEPQGSGNLGERLVRAARAAARDGVEALVIVGSDAPLLPRSRIEAAFDTLRSREAVAAPAEDGGYVLIGVAPARVRAARLDRLFSGIPWGTDEVLEATRAQAAAAAPPIDLAELPGFWDVDRPEDLARLHREIAALAAPDRPRRLAELLRRLPPAEEAKPE